MDDYEFSVSRSAVKPEVWLARLTRNQESIGVGQDVDHNILFDYDRQESSWHHVFIASFCSLINLHEFALQQGVYRSTNGGP